MATHLSPFIPHLPKNETEWSEDVLEAHRELSHWYLHAKQALSMEDTDPTRLRALAKEVDMRCRPLCMGLGACGLPDYWLDECKSGVVDVILELEKVAEAVASMNRSSKVCYLRPVTIQKSCSRGRPSKKILKTALRHIIKQCPSISDTGLARIFQVHRHTLRKYLRKYRLSRKRSAISDDELDQHVREFKTKHPDSGTQFLVVYLRSAGVNVTWTRARASKQRVDPIVPALRRGVKIKRRNYENPRSDAVWHMDGHHKLILWGWVIHGVIDGHDHTLRSIRAETNNRADTVLHLFLKAVEENGGPPQRVRGDCGGENVKVAAWMVQNMGENRGSYMFGTIISASSGYGAIWDPNVGVHGEHFVCD
ncbi:hypothetical protein FRC12_004068 [Ceratobasidium sp. 428]|nr:hypothetical protein FRC12_004068 [Ceratobasidium sp. 428]